MATSIKNWIGKLTGGMGGGANGTNGTNGANGGTRGGNGHRLDSATITGTMKERPPEIIEEMKKELSEISKVSTKTKRVLYPFSAIIGQERIYNRT